MWFIEAEQYSAFFARVLNQPHMRYFSVGIVLFKKIFCVWFIEAEQPSAFFFCQSFDFTVHEIFFRWYRTV